MERYTINIVHPVRCHSVKEGSPMCPNCLFEKISKLLNQMNGGIVFSQQELCLFALEPGHK